MPPRYNLARTKARDLLREFGVSEPPVDPVSIAKRLGVQVLAVQPPDEDMSGFLVREDPDSGETIIGVNRHHSPVRRRFTVAHELGHFLLGHKGDWHVDNVTLSFRDENSSTGEHEHEIEANQFAAALLMPKDWIEQDVFRGEVDISDDSQLRQLAKRYRVSAQAMTFRVANLNLLS